MRVARKEILGPGLHVFRRRRPREGRPETIETTSLHLDVLRDLKRIRSRIWTVAYPVLEAAGTMAAADVAESDPITLSAPSAKPH